MVVRMAAGPAEAARGQENAVRRRGPGRLPWIAVDTDHLRHVKCLELAAELDDPRAPLHVAPVWYWFAEKYPEGSMPDRPSLVRALEAAALWTGKPGELVRALVKVGLLDRVGTTSADGRLAVHDWALYQEPHIKRRAADREYQRRRRAESREKARPDIVTTSAVASPSNSRSPSESGASASDGRGSETSPSAPPTQPGDGLDVEEQAILGLLPAKAVDLAAGLDLPKGSVDAALEDFQRRGLVRLRGGLVPLWELTPEGRHAPTSAQEVGS